MIIFSVDQDSFASFFIIWMPSISFSCHIALARLFSMREREMVQVDILVLFLFLVESIWSLTTKYNAGCRFYPADEIPLYSYFIEGFLLLFVFLKSELEFGFC